MSYGIQAINDAGFYQVNSEDPTLGLAAKGRITPPSDGSSFYMLSLPGLTSPIIALTGGAYVVATSFSGSTWTWYIGFLLTAINGTRDFDYFVFDPVAGASAPVGGHGVEVFNGSGQRVYSSDAKLLNVLSRFNIPYGNTTTSRDFGPTYPHGSRRLAVVTGRSLPTRTTVTGSRTEVPYPGVFINFYYYTISGYGPYVRPTNVAYDGGLQSHAQEYSTFEVPADPPPPSVSYSGDWDFYLIDVTNL